MGSPFSFDRAFRNYSDFWSNDPADDFVTLSEEEKRKKREDEEFENLPWYMKYDKQIKDALLGPEEAPSALGQVVKGIETPFDSINKGRDIATSAIAGVPEQPYRATLEGALAPNEELASLDIGSEFAPPEPPAAIKNIGIKGLEAATDPSQLLPIGALGPAGAMLTAPVFGPKMISAGGEGIGKGISGLESGDTEQGISDIAGGMFDIGMGGLAIKHPIEAGGEALKETNPALFESSAFDVGVPSAQRGAVGDISKLNVFEDSQFRKYGNEWRAKQSPEETSYHQSLLKGSAPVAPPLARLSEALTDPDLAPRIDELVKEGYEVNRAVRIAKAERAEIPEEILSPEDVTDYMEREHAKEVPMEAEIIPEESTSLRPIKSPIEPEALPTEPLIGTEEPMMAEPIRRGRPRLPIRGPAPIRETLRSEGEEKPLVKSEVKPSEETLREDITDIPKSLRAGFDVSFPGRQGLFLLNRPEGRAGVGRGFKSFKEREHESVQKDLASRPNAQLYEDFGLQQVKYDPKQIEQRSEDFPATHMIEKIPGLKQSERIFIDQGNLMRANVFDALHEKWSEQGKTPENRPDLYRGAAKYLNVLTGRDTLPKRFAQAGYILNKVMFSPRFVQSRLQLLNPAFYGRLPRELQLEALRDVGGTLGTLSLLLGGTVAAARTAGYDDKDIDIGGDPRATNFGKLKIKNVSYDFFSSLLPLIRTAARLTTGTKITPSGEYRLGGLTGGGVFGSNEGLPEAPFGASAGTELATLGEGKLSPLASVSKGLLTGEGFAGEEYGLGEATRDLFEPMAISEFRQALIDHDAGTAAMTLPGLLGIGVQTDIPRPKPSRKASSSFGRSSSARKRKRAW